MSTQLFNRQWSVTIGPPGQPGFAYGNIPVNLVQLPSPLRIVFDIDKFLIGSSNKSKIEIYNLNQQSRRKYRPGYQITLQAGYSGLVRTITVADIPINGVRSKRQGPDIVTSFESGEGEKNIADARLVKNYPPGSKLVDIVTDLANALGLGVSVISKIPNVTFNSALVFAKSVREILTTLLKDQNLEWSVQNGSLQIIPKGSYLGEAIVLSNQPAVNQGDPGLTGLIGVPSQMNGYVEFTALLNPRIVPGSFVQLISDNVNGFYKVRRAHFEGDTHGDKWEVKCEAFPLPAGIELTSQNLNILTAA